MNKINNFITKIIHNNNFFDIITYIDFKKLWSNEEMQIIFDKNIKCNKILRTNIQNIEGNLFWSQINELKYNDYITFFTDTSNNFNNYNNKILDYVFGATCKWHIFIVNDNKNNTSRIYLKISHIYSDGYSLIKMIFSLFDCDYKPPKFKREQHNIIDSLYYYIIGTIILIYINIKNAVNIVFEWTYNLLCGWIYGDNTKINSKVKSNLNKTFKVNLDSLSAFKEKINTLSYKINKKYTINDVLYGICIKSYQLYFGKHDLFVTSPININFKNDDKNDLNNFNFIANNHYDFNCSNLSLLNNISDLFNLYKSSAFILLTYVLFNYVSYVSESLMDFIVKLLINKTDIIYTNIIGPDISLYENIMALKVKDINLMLVPYDDKICYSIITANDNINISITYKDGVIDDEKRFKKCIDEAYSYFFDII